MHSHGRKQPITLSFFSVCVWPFVIVPFSNSSLILFQKHVIFIINCSQNHCFSVFPCVPNFVITHLKHNISVIFFYFGQTPCSSPPLPNLCIIHRKALCALVQKSDRDVTAAPSVASDRHEGWIHGTEENVQFVQLCWFRRWLQLTAGNWISIEDFFFLFV